MSPAAPTQLQVIAPPLPQPDATPAPSITKSRSEGENAPGSEPGSVPVELLVHTMNSTFNKESIDRRWAHEAAAGLRNTIGEMIGSAGSIREVDCRSSMCRIQTVFPSEREYQMFADRVGHTSSICRQCFLTKTGETSDGGWIMTLYSAREGADLPRAF